MEEVLLIAFFTVPPIVGYFLNKLIIVKLSATILRIFIVNAVRTLCYCPTVITIGHGGFIAFTIIAIPSELTAYGGGDILKTLTFPLVFFIAGSAIDLLIKHRRN